MGPDSERSTLRLMHRAHRSCPRSAQRHTGSIAAAVALPLAVPMRACAPTHLPPVPPAHASADGMVSYK